MKLVLRRNNLFHQQQTYHSVALQFYFETTFSQTMRKLFPDYLIWYLIYILPCLTHWLLLLIILLWYFDNNWHSSKKGKHSIKAFSSHITSTCSSNFFFFLLGKFLYPRVEAETFLLNTDTFTRVYFYLCLFYLLSFHYWAS